MTERIFDDDPEAIIKLEAWLIPLKERQAYWRKVKKVPRTYQHDEPEGARKSFILPSITTKIREITKRIDKLQFFKDEGIKQIRKVTFRGGGKHFWYAYEDKNGNEIQVDKAGRLL